MIIVARNALAQTLVVEGRFVHTRLKELGLSCMTLPTHIRHRGDAWRRGAMVAVTIVAGGRGEILPLVQCLRVYTLFVFRVLIRWDLELGHAFGLRVALRARLSH